MNFHVLTLFPDMIRKGLSDSIMGRAAEKGLITVDAVDIRDFTQDKHRKVDDYPYGGGAGLLMQAQPVCDAHRFLREKIGADRKVRTLYLTPQGKTFNQRMAEELSRIFPRICNHLFCPRLHWRMVSARSKRQFLRTVFIRCPICSAWAQTSHRRTAGMCRCRVWSCYTASQSRRRNCVAARRWWWQVWLQRERRWLTAAALLNGAMKIYAGI